VWRLFVFACGYGYLKWPAGLVRFDHVACSIVNAKSQRDVIRISRAVEKTITLRFALIRRRAL
jgi:hypothetical protein